MNKAELVDVIAKNSGLPKASCEKSLNALTTVIQDTLKKGDKILLVGFGTFQVQNRKATQGVNPRTKEKISIPAKKVAKLKFSDSLNDVLNK
jgi:DNA-binding protein HU-beta